MTSEFKAAASLHKAQTRAQWDKAANGWDRHAPEIRNWLSSATAAMLNMAAVASGQDVLDVAAGAGDQTLDLARRVGPQGSVVATDISPVILALAAKNAAEAGFSNVTTHLADAENLGLAEASFDAAICRLGLMFLPDPLAGLTEINRALRPNARFSSLVFAGPEQNPCMRILMSTALKHAGLPPRDPFKPGGLMSLGKPGDIETLFQQAGFREVTTTPMATPFRMPTTQGYLQFIRDAAGPILQILSPLDPATQEAAWADITAQLDAFQSKDGWEGPNTLLLTVGQK